MIWDEQLLVVFCACGRLEGTLEAAEDTAIDIPHIWLYLAELITPMLHEDGISMGQLFRWAICRKSTCSFGMSDTFSLVNTFFKIFKILPDEENVRDHMRRQVTTDFSFVLVTRGVQWDDQKSISQSIWYHPRTTSLHSENLKSLFALMDWFDFKYNYFMMHLFVLIWTYGHINVRYRCAKWHRCYGYQLLFFFTL